MSGEGRSLSRAIKDEASGCRHGAVEWGYRIGDDPYVVQMTKEKYVRDLAQSDPGVIVVRRFISDWEEA